MGSRGFQPALVVNRWLQSRRRRHPQACFAAVAAEIRLLLALARTSRAKLIFACLGDKVRVLESLDHDAAIGPIRMG